jgi:hypothetical protein
MSNIFDLKNPYFQTPQRVRKFRSKDWTLAEKLLHEYLLSEAQRTNMIVLVRSNAQITEDTGLDDSSIRSARTRLAAKNFILLHDAPNREYAYTLCGVDGLTLDPPVHAAPNRSYNLDFNHCTPEQYRLYYETRLGCKLDKDQNNVACPFHDDHRPSLSIIISEGAFNCHVCELAGGMVPFEIRFSGCGKAEAGRNINQIIKGSIDETYEAKYDYLDESDTLVYQILRMGKGNKHRFTARRPVQIKGTVKWVYNLHGIPKVLYHLPDVVARQWNVVTEGEKDADNVDRLGLLAPDGSRYATTTNPFGAGKWINEFSPYFHRKKVLILGDNDSAGKAHAESVQRSISLYTFSKDITVLTDWQWASDVSDYIVSHTPPELRSYIELQTSQAWFSHPEESVELVLEA